jgi:hypothetical protein
MSSDRDRIEARLDEACRWHPLFSDPQHRAKVLRGTGKKCESCTRVDELAAALAARAKEPNL